MRAAIYKVLTRLPLPADPDWDRRGALASFRSGSLAEARRYLACQNREGHLLNLYYNLSDDGKAMKMVWAFSDRDTALMFKLEQG